MMEQIPYARMGKLLAGRKGYCEQDQDWASHPLGTLIWKVVNKEIRVKGKGRQLASEATTMGAQATGQMVPYGGEGQMAMVHRLPINASISAKDCIGPCLAR